MTIKYARHCSRSNTLRSKYDLTLPVKALTVPASLNSSYCVFMFFIVGFPEALSKEQLILGNEIREGFVKEVATDLSL